MRNLRKSCGKEVHDALEASVKRQLMSDVPYGVLLSGGLDSSVISAVAESILLPVWRTGRDQGILASSALLRRWFEGAPDLAKARLVAEHIGTVHHEINYTIRKVWMPSIVMSSISLRPMMLPPCVHLPRCIFGESHQSMGIKDGTFG